MSLPEIMTIEEVAAHLRVSERTVYDWAQKGEIPCGKFGTSWRFKREDIERWIDSCLNSSRPKSDFIPVDLAAVLTPERVVVMERANKAEVLNKLIDLLAASEEVKSKDELAEGIYLREQLMSTGIGMEIAIPHVRLRSVRDVAVAAALVREGVEGYESLDSQPVKLVFMIVAREDQHAQHLKLLSQISSNLKNEENRRILAAASDSAGLYRLLAGNQ